MEVKKQANRTYLMPEQVKANLAQSKHNWYLNNKDYYKPGGHGYECLTSFRINYMVKFDHIIIFNSTYSLQISLSSV